MHLSFLKSLSTINWKYILGELTLIVVGISIALWVGNFNSNKEERQLEKTLLMELKACLQQDLNDAKSNLEVHKKGMEEVDLLFGVLSQSTPISDTLLNHLFNAGGWTFLVSNASAYKSIESIGFQLIRDDSLRNNISSLYNANYKYIFEIEENHYKNRDRFNTLLLEVFQYDQNRMFINSAALSANKMKIITSLLFIRNSHESLSTQYKDQVIPEIEALINQITERYK